MSLSNVVNGIRKMVGYLTIASQDITPARINPKCFSVVPYWSYFTVLISCCSSSVAPLSGTPLVLCGYNGRHE